MSTSLRCISTNEVSDSRSVLNAPAAKSPPAERATAQPDKEATTAVKVTPAAAPIFHLGVMGAASCRPMLPHVSGSLRRGGALASGPVPAETRHRRAPYETRVNVARPRPIHGRHGCDA
ncbi:MAG: hypothetical protein AMXMBFR53_14650 [Gemmatimonadota bacterium]